MVRGLLALSLTFAAARTTLASEKPPTTWNPAASCNYSNISYNRGITHIIIHTVEGSDSSAISWFKDCASNVSAHYVISYGGEITQMVSDQDIAWHAGSWYYNLHSIGIEHEGYASKNYWTQIQYQESAALVRWICLTNGIPMSREHILGHNEVSGYKSDPGPYFNWNYFMSLVTQGGPLPAPPSTPAFKAHEVTASSLNVRSGPSMGNAIIGGVLAGQRYVSIATSGGWRKIYYKNNTGWCYEGYLTTVTGVVGVKIDVASLRVRKGPSTGTWALGSVSAGQRYVQATGSNGWRRIWWGGGAYWVYAGYTSTFGL